YSFKTSSIIEELDTQKQISQQYSHCQETYPTDPTTQWFVEVVREGNEDGHGQPRVARRGNRNNEQ
ncbi:MAG: hypothetical protein M3Y39_20155, partial [Chloroflexota bacterium]|nr:hypothetical protein [Chloroflexota bacterium]